MKNKVIYKGREIGYTEYNTTYNGWESVCYFSDFGRLAKNSKEEAIKDVITIYRETLLHNIQTLRVLKGLVQEMLGCYSERSTGE